MKRHLSIRLTHKQYRACTRYQRYLNRLLGLDVSVSDVIRMAVNWLVQEVRVSEFECSNGHLMTGPVCSICGGRVYKMDGYTSKDWEMMENGPDREEEEDDDM